MIFVESNTSMNTNYVNETKNEGKLSSGVRQKIRGKREIDLGSN